LFLFNFHMHCVGKTAKKCMRIVEVSTAILQVAHLWQRDRAKLEMFSINVQRYSQNHAQNCIFGPLYVRIQFKVMDYSDISTDQVCTNRIVYAKIL